MIESFSVERFRCFQRLELAGLRRVNVIVGENASGKTAILEAIRLGLAATPGVLWQLNPTRSVNNFLPTIATRETFEALWSGYFFNADGNASIRTACRDRLGRGASLDIHYDASQAITAAGGEAASQVGSSTVIPLAFQRTDFSGRSSCLYAGVPPQGAGLRLDPGNELGIDSEFLPATFFNHQAAAAWFSQLSLQNRDAELVAAVREEFPLIENLAVLTPNAGIGNIYATVRRLREKLPLSLVSAGISKFCSLAACIMTRSGGVVLIDEIENGFFHDRLEPLWRALHRLATRYDTQIFTSTHSLECLRALQPTLRGNEADFCLLRAEFLDGRSRVSNLAGSVLETGLQQEFELR